jgi:hypothetical protein
MPFTGNYVTNTYKNGLNTGAFNLGTGTTQTFKIALYTNEASLDATTTSYTSTGEVVASGYTAGGSTLSISTVPTVDSGSTTSYYSFANVSWPASLSLPPVALTARGALIYLANGTTNPAMIVLDFGSDKTSTTTFSVQFPAATNTTAIIRIS